MKRRKPRVALISPQVIGAEKQVRRVQPPLGIACLAAVLESRGFDNVLIIDAAAEDYNNVTPVKYDTSLIRFGMPDESIARKVREFQPDIIGISSLFSSQVGCALSIAASLKKSLPAVPVIFGGIHASIMHEEIMTNAGQVDFIIRGEGDYALAEFADKYVNREDYTDVPGLIWRNGSTINKNPAASSIKDLDRLPFPAWHLMDMENYFSIGMPHNPFTKSNRVGCIMTSRGCPQHCYFCSSSGYFGHTFRAMSASRVIEMIHYMIDRFGIRELQIEDDTFTLNHKRVIEICEGIKHLNLRITLPNAIRGDVPRDHNRRLEMFRAMHSAGVEQIGISIEHGDQDFLNNVIDKKLDLNEAVVTSELAHKAGLLTHANFMIGFPLETARQREKTIEFAKAYDADSFSVSLATPLPGTAMWNIVEENRLFLDSFRPDRILYSQTSIRPHDISPDDLHKLVDDLNRELNERAQKKRPETIEKYKLFRGKTAHGDRKYHHVSSGN